MLYSWNQVVYDILTLALFIQSTTLWSPQVVKYNTSSFLLIAEEYSMVWNTMFVQPFTCFGYFQFLAIINKAARSIENKINTCKNDTN